MHQFIAWQNALCRAKDENSYRAATESYKKSCKIAISRRVRSFLCAQAKSIKKELKNAKKEGYKQLQRAIGGALTVTRF